MVALFPALNCCAQRSVDDILHCYFLATHYDPTWYKAWHTWALANFEVIGHLESQVEHRSVNKAGLVAHVVQAVEGEYLVASRLNFRSETVQASSGRSLFATGRLYKTHSGF